MVEIMARSLFLNTADTPITKALLDYAPPTGL